MRVHFRILTPAQLRLHPTPALVVDAQGGVPLGLGPERGELGADFCFSWRIAPQRQRMKIKYPRQPAASRQSRTIL
jgi:hypothetical protein